jgi:hypothetical protein
MEQGLPAAFAAGVDRYLDAHFTANDERSPVALCAMMAAHGWEIVDTDAIAPDLAVAVRAPELGYRRLYRRMDAPRHIRRAVLSWVLASAIVGRGPLIRVPMWTTEIPMGDSDPEVAAVSRHILVPDRLLYQCGSIREIIALCDVPPLTATGRVRTLPIAQQAQFMDPDEWLTIPPDRRMHPRASLN